MGVIGNSHPQKGHAVRIGQNPNKQAPASVFPPQLATVTTHLPKAVGYHEWRLGIVQASLITMRRYSGVPVMVWDNGSCDELRAWLINDYKPDYLILSPNVGKQSARRAMAGMLPPETIVGFTDDDMLFYPSWWSASLDLLTGYPNVGAVSAWANRVSFDWGTKSALDWAAKSGAKVERGHFIPTAHEADYATSVGLAVGEHLSRVAPRQDIRITYNGLTAYAQAQHCQFICYANRILPHCDYTETAMGGERIFDDKIDAAGLLRLATTERFARHMGNVIDDKLEAELETLL